MNIHQINANRRARARHDAIIRNTLITAPDHHPDHYPETTIEDCRELWARMDAARDRALVKLGCEVPHV